VSKVLWDTFYYVSYNVSDYRFQHDLIPCGQRLSFFERVHNDDRVKLLLKVAVCLLKNHKAVGLVLVQLTINFCLWTYAVYF
jgi:hypothetical protein